MRVKMKNKLSPELKAAEAKQARKNAKRLRDAGGSATVIVPKPSGLGPTFKDFHKRDDRMQMREIEKLKQTAAVSRARHREARAGLPRKPKRASAAELRSPVPEGLSKKELRSWANDRIREEQRDRCDLLIAGGMPRASAETMFGSL